jgi:hypothetical protein
VSCKSSNDLGLVTDKFRSREKGVGRARGTMKGGIGTRGCCAIGSNRHPAVQDQRPEPADSEALVDEDRYLAG